MKKLYIIADTKDNSITLSPGLCDELHIDKGIIRIFLFKIKDEKSFAFKRVSQKFAEQTECGIVSFNPILKTYGFIALCPTVNLLFYEMGIESETKKFKIAKTTLSDNSIIYKIND